MKNQNKAASIVWNDVKPNHFLSIWMDLESWVVKDINVRNQNRQRKEKLLIKIPFCDSMMTWKLFLGFLKVKVVKLL